MSKRNCMGTLLCALLLPALAAAQEPAPQFTLTNPASAPGFTNNPAVAVNRAWPTTVTDCPSGGTCHLEFCLTGNSDISAGCAGNWTHSVQANYFLGAASGEYTVYGEYVVVAVDSLGNSTRYPRSPDPCPRYAVKGASQ